MDRNGGTLYRTQHKYLTRDMFRSCRTIPKQGDLNVYHQRQQGDRNHQYQQQVYHQHQQGDRTHQYQQQ